MANGDIAASLGIPLVAPTDDVREGYDQINRSLDVTAQHMQSGTHPFTAITGRSAALVPNKSGGNVQGDLDFLGQRINAVDGKHSGNIGRPGQGGSIEDALLSVAGTANNAQGSANQANQTANAAYTGNLSTDSYNRSVSGQSVKVAYLGNSGQLGFSTSSERFKKDVLPFDVSDEAMAAVQLVTYRYNFQGSETPVEVGVIAERLIEAGLGWLVFFDEDGQPLGVHYERISLALISTIQRLMQRVDALEQAATTEEEAS